MRIRYTGDQATEHTGEAGTGLWQRGETKDVPDAVAVALVATGAWTVEEAPKRRRAASEGSE